MVAAVTVWPDTDPAAIHRTYLSPDGLSKAAVEPTRMALGPLRGGCIRLADALPTLVIAEGVETALSVQQATGIPAWAAISASNMSNVVLPPLPLAVEIIIAADRDRAGIKAAYQSADLWRSQGRQVRVALPRSANDFNDQLRGTA
jgi:phage/plasmid primase-like uncharacterized protein